MQSMWIKGRSEGDIQETSGQKYDPDKNSQLEMLLMQHKIYFSSEQSHLSEQSQASCNVIGMEVEIRI